MAPTQTEKKKVLLRQPSLKSCGGLWKGVDHIAFCVSNVGKSLNFYTNVVGMRKAKRPTEGRNEAWLSMGNLSLHLIKGRPAVHLDHDLIVGHLAIPIPSCKLEELKVRLVNSGIEMRQNLSVPNPSAEGAIGDEIPLDQFFVRDPDGYYVEFATAEGLEHFLSDKLDESESVIHSSNVLIKAAQFGSKLSAKAKLGQLDEQSDHQLHALGSEKDECTARGLNLDFNNLVRKIQDGYMKIPSWVLPDDELKRKLNNLGPGVVNEGKLADLIKRRGTYGDITQNATETQLRYLMSVHHNDVQLVIKALHDWVAAKGSKSHIQSASCGKDESVCQLREIPIAQH